MENLYSIPRNGLVGEWLLDGNALDTNDGTKNNGTATSVTYVNTPIGYQKQYGVFNGSSSKVIIADSSTYSFTNKIFSLSVWINTSSTSANNSIFTKSATGPNYEYDIFTDSSGRLKATLWTSAGGTCWSGYTSTAVNDGKWHHIGVVFNNTYPLIYIDGVSQSVTGSGSGGTVADLGASVGIGSRSAGDLLYTGNIQSVRLYNRVLSEREIQALYLEGKRKLAGGSDDILKNCVTYYDFNGDANDVVSGYNGTVTGATLTTDRFGISNKAYSFDGNNYINVTTAKRSGSCTIFAIINPANITGDKHIFSDWTSSQRNLLFGITGSSIVGISGNGGSLQNTTVTGGTIIANERNYIAITRYGGTVTIYLNGVSVGTNTGSYTGGSTSNNVYIGAFSDLSGGFFNGIIESVIIFNTAKTADEVKELYNLSKTRYLYPFKKTLPLHLRNGLQLWIPGYSSGTTYYDVSGNNKNGTAYNTPVTTRIFEHKKTTFNGTSQYINLGTGLPAQTVSVNAWVYLKSYGGSTQDYIRGILCKYTTPGQPTWILRVGDGTSGNAQKLCFGGSTVVLDSNSFPLNKWVMVTGVSNGSTIYLYMNGKLITSTSYSLPANTDSVYLGLDFGNGSVRYWDGNIANSMIWNKALTGTEIQQLYYSTYIQ